jgi:hypothetical protein
MIRKRVVPVLGCIMALLIVVALGGCATSTGGKQGESAVQAPPVPVLEKPYGYIIVYEIETTPVLQKDYAEDLKYCKATVIESLLKRNKYNKVEAATSSETYDKPALLVKIKVSDMRIASFGARFMVGALAGSSYMNMRMKLVDAQTQQVVRDEDFASANNAIGAAYSFGATDRGMPYYMGEIMADYIDKAVPAM